MNIVELIIQAGVENVRFQNIEQSLVSVNTGKKNGTITFATDRAKTLNLAASVVTGEKPQFVGFVVWIPQDRIPDLNAEKKDTVRLSIEAGTDARVFSWVLSRPVRVFVDDECLEVFR